MDFSAKACPGSHIGSKLLSEKFSCQLFACEVEVRSDIAKDFRECAHFELSVGRHRNMMFDAFELRGDTDVAAGLTSHFITETAQRSNEFFTADIAGKLQAGMTSSLTM